MPADDPYERHIEPMESRLIATAWRVLRDHEDVGDTLQDALTRIWKHREQLDSHPNPQAWMLRIVLNAAYDRLRHRKVRRTEALPSNLASNDTSASSKLQNLETRARLLDEISRLSPQQAQAILLRVVENMPYDAIAAALGCSESTARVHVQRSRRKLHDRLIDLQPHSPRSRP
jgi:RNA polymerase sigma-70 factor (ECF subfamily)